MMISDHAHGAAIALCAIPERGAAAPGIIRACLRGAHAAAIPTTRDGVWMIQDRTLRLYHC